MTHPLDFNDGLLRCDQCGVVFPGELARRAYRIIRYSDEPTSQTTLTICPTCDARTRRRSTFRIFGMIFGIVGIVGLIWFVLIILYKGFMPKFGL